MMHLLKRGMEKVTIFSNFNLGMTNLWIGLCRGVVGLPSDLRKLGYDAKWIEYNFANSDNEMVKPELIAFSNQLGHTLILEWKSGANTEPDQLRRYSRIASEDLRTKAFIDRPAFEKHNVTLICKDEKKERIKIGIETGNYNFPIISTVNDGLQLHFNQFDCYELNQIFSPLLPIDFSIVTTCFVPFDNDSELWEIAEFIMPQIFEYMFQRQPHFLLDDLITDTVPTWGMMGPEFKCELRKKMLDVVNEASRQEFRNYFRRNQNIKARTHTETWEIILNPLDLTTDKRNREFRQIKKIQGIFIEALKTGQRPSRQFEFEEFGF